MYQRVRRIRQKAGVSQIRVAQAAHKSLAWAAQIEYGVLTPSRADAQKVADLLDRNVEDLFDRVRETEANMTA